MKKTANYKKESNNEPSKVENTKSQKQVDQERLLTLRNEVVLEAKRVAKKKTFNTQRLTELVRKLEDAEAICEDLQATA